jgi:hypothetical protein
MGKKTYDISGEVTEFDPPTHMGMRHSGGPFAMEEWLDLKSGEGGTTMTQTVTLRPENRLLRVLFAVVGPVMGLFMKGQLKKELRALKGHVEEGQ